MAHEISPWMRQDMKKGGNPAAPSVMEDKIYPRGTVGQMNPKVSAPTHALGNLVTGSMKKTPLHMADGGDVSEASDKAAGLEASKGESVGFFERLRMGNIDDPSSEAYARFGAGRGATERIKALPDDGSSEAAESRRFAAAAPAPAPKAEEAPKMTAVDFQRTDKDTTPVAMPAPRPARNAMRASASKPAAPAAPASPRASSASLSQRLGKEYADLENAAKRAEAMPEATLESKRMVRKLADDKRKAYEAAADAEKTGRSVVMKR